LIGKYKIKVKGLEGEILYFTVNYYETKEGFIHFYDKLTKKKKIFPVNNCEFVEVAEDG